MNLGEFKGEICNRNGCKGIIKSRDKKGSCTCFNNPPCNYCTTLTEYCEECGWDAEEEAYENYINKEPVDTSHYDEWQKKRNEMLEFYRSDKKADFFYCFSEGHTHFSMRKFRMYPPEWKKEELIKKIRDSWGGRFKSLDEELGRFDYIAHTD